MATSSKSHASLTPIVAMDEEVNEQVRRLATFAMRKAAVFRCSTHFAHLSVKPLWNVRPKPVYPSEIEIIEDGYDADVDRRGSNGLVKSRTKPKRKVHRTKARARGSNGRDDIVHYHTGDRDESSTGSEESGFETQPE